MALRKFVGYVSSFLALSVATGWVATEWVAGQGQGVPGAPKPARERQLLYVVVPGSVERGHDSGVGVLVFDVRNNFRFVKRISTWDYPASQGPDMTKGVAAHPATGLLYISTEKRLAAFDLATEKKVWDEAYEGRCCDRMAISPDGKIIYSPSFTEPRDRWFVIDAVTGKLIKTIHTPDKSQQPAHNTIYAPDGSRVFMAGGTMVSVADPKTHTVVQRIGPFAGRVRPFTINGRATHLFATVDDMLLGFQVADLKTGQVIHRVEVVGYGHSRERWGAHGTPSHGIALTPDEKELWLPDSANDYLHVFDATVMPPKQKIGMSVKLRSKAYWITMGLDGKYVYPSNGDVIDAATKQVVAILKDEYGRDVRSEKLVELLFSDGKLVRAVDQFGVGLVRGRATN